MGIVHDIETPYTWPSKLVLVFVVLLAARRTLSFLKIFEPLTTIVVMLQTVLYDLRIFVTFYLILLLFLSLNLCVLGPTNVNMPGRFRDRYGSRDENGDMIIEDADKFKTPNGEYHVLG